MGALIQTSFGTNVGSNGDVLQLQFHVPAFGKDDGLQPEEWSDSDSSTLPFVQGGTENVEVSGALLQREGGSVRMCDVWNISTSDASGGHAVRIFLRRHKSLGWISFARHWRLQALCLVLEGAGLLLSCIVL